MNRRNFIQLLSLTIGGIAVAPTLPASGYDAAAYKTAEVLDRISTRRLVLYIRDAMSDQLAASQFEPNDHVTRQHLASMATVLMNDLQFRECIDDFKVVCDETNNSDDPSTLRCSISMTRKGEDIRMEFALGRNFNPTYDPGPIEVTLKLKET